MSGARQGEGEALDLRPWAAGVDAALVVDLLWPLRFQPEQALPWVADILERATMAERRLPVLADWARRWRVIEGDSRGDLPMVHARWVGDVGGGDGGGGPREPTPRGEPPRVQARRSKERRAAPPSAPAAASRTHANASDRGSVRAEIEGLPRGEAGASGRRGATGARGTDGRDGPSGRDGGTGPAGEDARATQVVVGEARTPVVRARGDERGGADAALERRRDGDAAASVSEAPARQSVVTTAERGAEADRRVVATSSAATAREDAAAMPHAREAVRDAIPGTSPAQEVRAAARSTSTPERGGAARDLGPVIARARGRRVQSSEAPSIEHVLPRAPAPGRGEETGFMGHVDLKPRSASAGLGEAAAPRPIAQARGPAETSDARLVEAADRAARGPAEAGSPPPSRRVQARPRVQARRPDDLPIEATMFADPRRPVRPRERAQTRSRARVASSLLGDERAPPELDHLAAAAIVAARAQTTTAGANPGAQQGAVDGASAPVTKQAAAAVPEVDVDALVQTVKKRLAREIRWERELRRAIG
ncbi:MAG: hypothetical protein R3A79_25055 [Nannocystaceae bacterium]